MAYTTPSKVQEVMRKLPQRVTDQDIQFHIDKAEAYINGLLGEVFYTPFDPVPKLIEVIATDLSVFFLAESLYSSNLPNLDEYQKTRYERSIKMLSEIAGGDLVLVLDTGEVVKMKSAGSNGYATTNDEQIFTYDDPEW